MPLDKFLEERIYKPLEMNGSGFQVKGTDLDRFVYLDPKEDLVTVFMITLPALRNHYRYLIKSMIYQAIVE